MARKSTRQRAESRRAQQQRQRQTRLIIAVAVIAVVVVGIIIVATGPSDAVALVETDYEGIPQQRVTGDTGVGFAIGEPDAPVTITDYSDFSCPHCHDLSGPLRDIIEEYGRDGQVRVVFKPISFVNPPYSRPAAQAAICAGDQGKFWEMHDQIWALYEANGPGAYTPAQLTRLAEGIGLNMDEYRQCYSSPGTEAAVDSVLAEAQERGIQGTPTLFVNGQEVPYRGADAVYNDLAFVIEEQMGGS